MIRTFVGLPFFEREWQRLGLGDEERRALESELLENPTKGAIIAGLMASVRFADQLQAREKAVASECSIMMTGRIVSCCLWP